MKLLIPGGAGYIGSHMVKYALAEGHEVTILDNFSTGHKWATQGCEVLKVDLLDYDSLISSLEGKRFDGVIHFAAKSIVSQSVIDPMNYYLNNVQGTINLVRAMLENDINNIVFSSTAAIFGNPLTEKIDESHPKNPLNPYGKSKLIIENILEDFCNSYDLNAVCLRYFNAAGADYLGEIGEAHDPETHLIPNILNSILKSKQDLKVYGNDYHTHDGTCIRDYIHVNDLAQAHLLALNNNKSQNFNAYNLGNGNGFSVLEVIKACEKITNKSVLFSYHDRREGDPKSLISDSKKAIKELNWRPEYSSLDQIVSTAWNWHKKILDNKLRW